MMALFLVFFQIGLFSVGGGYAAMPLIQSLVVESHGWLTMAEFTNLMTIAEMTPGPIAINSATFVGMRFAGLPGALVATIGLVAPSIIIILIVAAFLKRFRDSKLVNAVFYGLRPASTAMVASAGVSVAALALVNTGAVGLALVNWKGVALAAVLLVLTRWCKATKGLHPILFILASAVVGVVFSY